MVNSILTKTACILYMTITRIQRVNHGINITYQHLLDNNKKILIAMGYTLRSDKSRSQKELTSLKIETNHFIFHFNI